MYDTYIKKEPPAPCTVTPLPHLQGKENRRNWRTEAGQGSEVPAIPCTPTTPGFILYYIYRETNT